jgi:pyruvate dehydrogenase E1 component beta subunit
LRPLDLTTLAASAKKTGKVVIVEEGWPVAGLGAQIAESLYRTVFDYLDGPIIRVTGRDVPMPYARNLENAAIPEVNQVVAAVHQVLYRN